MTFTRKLKACISNIGCMQFTKLKHNHICSHLMKHFEKHPVLTNLMTNDLNGTIRSPRAISWMVVVILEKHKNKCGSKREALWKRTCWIRCAPLHWTVLVRLRHVLCHIKDLPKAIKSQVQQFADNCLLNGQIKPHGDQNDYKWASTLGMRFNTNRCYIISVWNSSSYYYLQTCDPYFQLMREICFKKEGDLLSKRKICMRLKFLSFPS